MCFYLLVVLFNMLICPRCGRVGIGIYEKRVKGHRYLYCAHRFDGRLKWCYIGKLSNSLPNSLPNFLKQRRDWCGGWDLNPRRPSPREPQSRPFDLARAPPRMISYFSRILSILLYTFSLISFAHSPMLI